jgi:nucleotide-binding universal stress UspA family protein
MRRQVMSYKTILVHADPGVGADARIRLAARLAQAADAHLIGCAPTGISRFLPQQALAAGGSALAARCAALRRDAAAALARFERIAGEEAFAACEARLVEDETGAGLSLAARYCDLVVVGQADPGAPDPLRPHDLAAYVMLTSGRPVLVLPEGPVPHDPCRGALVAWEGSVEATRAVAAALPLLQSARRTTVLGVGDGAAHAGTEQEACAGLAAWLGRHGIAARIVFRAPGGDVAESLLSAAAESAAGLLVMGGYGHARLRELILGGVTATVLRTMTLPLLFAH